MNNFLLMGRNEDNVGCGWGSCNGSGDGYGDGYIADYGNQDGNGRGAGSILSSESNGYGFGVKYSDFRGFGWGVGDMTLEPISTATRRR